MFISSDYLEITRKRALRRRYVRIIFAGGGLLVAGLYFAYQLRDWIMLPMLLVEQPADGVLLQGPKIVVEGVATPGTRLTVNGVTAYNEENGRFLAELLLPAGLHTIRVVSENRFHRVRSVERQIVVEELEEGIIPFTFATSTATSTQAGEIYQ